MESFSHRKGLKPVKSIIQVDSMDDDLRNRLWNALTVYYWNLVKPLPHKSAYLLSFSSNRDMGILIHKMWNDYFVKPIDEITGDWIEVYAQLKKYFFTCSWNEAYDFVQFVANNFPRDYTNSEFIKFCNRIFEKEVSAYRFVGSRIVQITSDEEINEIEEALGSSPSACKTHLDTALDLLSDRESPDYRNSIKESISAVESVCKKIAGNDKATLEDALRIIEKKVELHPALKKAFSALYAYTSDAEGIRHALMGESNLSFEDAKFMMVSCSAFANYLTAKASKAKIRLD
jgi:hypothetical protein